MAIWDDKFIPGLKKIADVIHRHEALAALQLFSCALRFQFSQLSTFVGCFSLIGDISHQGQRCSHISREIPRGIFLT
jgi:2,4-dienoyl-CoA reductase-like NADH-dependent reductase (Old Yellow Enzyme family)